MLGENSVETVTRERDNTKGLNSSASADKHLSGGDYQYPTSSAANANTSDLNSHLTKTMKVSHRDRDHIQEGPLLIEYQKLDVAEQSYGNASRQSHNKNNILKMMHVSRRKSLQEVVNRSSNRGSQTIINI